MAVRHCLEFPWLGNSRCIRPVKIPLPIVSRVSVLEQMDLVEEESH